VPYSEWEDYQDLKDWEEKQDASDKAWVKALIKAEERSHVSTSDYQKAMMMLRVLEQEDKDYRKLKGYDRERMVKFMEAYIHDNPDFADILDHMAPKPHGFSFKMEPAVQTPNGPDT